VCRYLGQHSQIDGSGTGRDSNDGSVEPLYTAYSAKLPMGPIRKLAGFNSANGFCFNTQTVVTVPDELLHLTPIGQWCYTGYDDVVEHSRLNGGLNATAVEVLKFFCELNAIYIQDAAALMAKHPDRADHPMFKEVPVFQSELFLTFKDTMKRLLDLEESPLDANLEKVIPGISQWQSLNHVAVTGLRNSVDALNSAIATGFHQMTMDSKS